MDLQTLLNQRKMSKYRLSKISGVPKTTIIDICAGRSAMERCSAKTVQQLAIALGCTMEDIMKLTPPPAVESGLPEDPLYFECELPAFLSLSIEAMKNALEKIRNGEEYYDWDCDFCDLQSSINVAETEQLISPNQAWLLREKYLGIERV